MVQITEPQVFLIGETSLVREGVNSYLEAIGAPTWSTEAPSGGEELSEIYGRLCYRSFGVDLNPNISKVTEGNDDYISNVVGSGHGSVFEHASVNFIFHNVSRVFTHELVRHRVGTAMSQESLRFVRLDKILFWFPTVIRTKPAIQAKILKVVEALEDLQLELARDFDLDSENLKFSVKKIITSALRRIAPIGLATTIGWTSNYRTLRYVIEARTSRHSEEEIRLVFGHVAELVKDRYPNMFADMSWEVVDGLKEYKFETRKL